MNNKYVQLAISNRYASIALRFMLSFLLIYIFLLVNNNLVFRWDAASYFWMSNIFVDDYGFSLSNFPVNLRGAIFPLMLMPFNMLAVALGMQAEMGHWIMISTLSGLFSLAFPILFEDFGRDKFIPFSLILLLIFFFGVFLVPLADLISLYLLIFSLVFIKIAYKEIRISKRINYKPILLFFFAGVFFYVAYNSRTIYQFAIIGIAIIFFVNIIVLPKKAYALIIALAFVVGFYLLASVQLYINMNNTDTFSIAPGGGIVYWHDLPLNIFQLQVGLELNFYETSLVYGETPTFRYDNNSGIQLINRYGIVRSYSDYFRLIARYPFEMIGIYMRSLIMSLNPISGGGMIYNRNGRFILTIANWTILFFLMMYIKRSIIDIENFMLSLKETSMDFKNSILALFAILLPVIFIIPGAMEERFAIGLWVVVYGMFAYVINIREEIYFFKQRKFYNSFLYVAGFFVAIAILTELYANNITDSLLPILFLDWF